jgi:uncharacterized membrane protein YeaQ/YmgE (transglycosylase-associated protein family)
MLVLHEPWQRRRFAMLDLFGWDVGMSAFAALLLIVGALAIGVIAHLIGTVRIGFEWLVTAVAALVGGYLGSEALGTVSTLGPVFEGLYILPAIVGALVVGFVVDAITRYLTSGSYLPEPRPI